MSPMDKRGKVTMSVIMYALCDQAFEREKLTSSTVAEEWKLNAVGIRHPLTSGTHEPSSLVASLTCEFNHEDWHSALRLSVGFWEGSTHIVESQAVSAAQNNELAAPRQIDSCE